MIILFGLLGGILVFLGASFLTAAVRDYLRGRASVTWPTVAGFITASRVAETRLGLQVRYAPVVRYRYAVDGIVYSRDNLALALDVTFGSRIEAEELLRSYLVDSTVQVRYDPRNPGTSVLRPGASLWFPSGAALIAFLFIAGGVAMVWLGAAR
jgi:hypothetical protein